VCVGAPRWLSPDLIAAATEAEAEHAVSVPERARWFSFEGVSEIEKQSLPEFFCGSYASKTPQVCVPSSKPRPISTQTHTHAHAHQLLHLHGCPDALPQLLPVAQLHGAGVAVRTRGVRLSGLDLSVSLSLSPPLSLSLSLVLSLCLSVCLSLLSCLTIMSVQWLFLVFAECFGCWAIVRGFCCWSQWCCIIGHSLSHSPSCTLTLIWRLS
jgi:hypothetical protein